MILKKLTPDHPDIPELKEIFEEAFPVNERPIGMDDLLANFDKVPGELLGIYPDETPDEFAGFFLTIMFETYAYLIYFATSQKKRSCGIGSKAIQAYKDYYSDRIIVFSYESIYEESDNAEQRERRRNFYLKNGFFETGWFAKANGTEFILASSKEEIDKDAFVTFLTGMSAGVENATVPELYRRD